MKSDLSRIFRESLKKTKVDFEFRPGQVAMAETVERALAESKFAAIEAGTGVGKSLAYLIPAIQFALESESQVVIATETKALQDQIYEKDIPLAKKTLGIDFRAELALGASNYICKRKLSKVLDKGDFGSEMTGSLQDFIHWEEKTIRGIKAEFSGYASNSFWQSVTRDPDNCLSKHCPNFSIS